VVTLVNEFVADLASEGTLPQVPATGSDISIRDMKDAYCWLGMLISNVQQHACIIAPFQLVSIHAMLDTAFKKFKALGIR